MYCPNCGSEDWVFTGGLPDVHKLDDIGYVALLDVPCYCPDCGCEFYRREEFTYTGSCDVVIIKESE